MNSSFFYLYLLTLIAFCIPLCYLITKDFFYFYYYIKSFDLWKSNKDYESLIGLYTKRKKWFFCIAIIEYLIATSSNDKIVLFNCLANCYKSLSYNNIAEFYYLRALSFDSRSLLTLYNLQSFFDSTHQIFKACKINKRIGIISCTSQ
uniref:Uncharacterized protein n=1 Tax=Platysiphonia delicata TaxID=2006979 RepID=A0A1Z1M0C1_9FLOR|nr:hypothetical protein [Platysiphonia delicata]ARW59489.1 hypothetical protein [Platysiphonia delicata]